MLVKVGDIWIDPLLVESVKERWHQRRKEPDPDAPPRPAGWIFLAEYEDDPTKPSYLEINTRRGEYTVEGVALDEAVRAINRCREQHMNHWNK